MSNMHNRQAFAQVNLNMYFDGLYDVKAAEQTLIVIYTILRKLSATHEGPI